MTKLKLPNVTLVSMSSVRVRDTVFALMKSMEHIDFGRVILLSDTYPSVLPSTVSFRYTTKINSIDDYSFKVVYELPLHIETEFALIVQYDGFVINPTSWQDSFFQYDYIGAPFDLPTDDFSYRDSRGEIFRVGNGGFSLRSRRLMLLPVNLPMVWEPFHGYYNEDGFICGLNRHIFESRGFKFAPFDVAKFFSHEKPLPEFSGIAPFGFHGKSSIYFRQFQSML